MQAAFKSWIAAALLLCASAATAAPTYWNVFNVEGESSLDAAIVTYATLQDMLNDENRTGLYEPDGSGFFGRNIVGGGFSFDATSSVPEPGMGWLALLALGAMQLTRRRAGPATSARRRA